MRDFGGNLVGMFPHCFPHSAGGGDNKSLQNRFKRFRHLFINVKIIGYEWN